MGDGFLRWCSRPRRSSRSGTLPRHKFLCA